METKRCNRCRKVIVKQPSEGLPYWKTKRFCSIKCSTIGRPSCWKGKTKPFMLGNKFRQGISPWNKGFTTKTSKKVAEYGKKSGASRLNKPVKPFRIINGYKCIFLPTHPRAGKCTKTVPEQILIMEKHLDRFLAKQEVVHHRNSDKLDNRIKNLRLFPNKSEHMKWHAFNDRSSGLKYGHQNGHNVSVKSRTKISNSLKEWYKHNQHWKCHKSLKTKELARCDL